MANPPRIGRRFEFVCSRTTTNELQLLLNCPSRPRIAGTPRRSVPSLRPLRFPFSAEREIIPTPKWLWTLPLKVGTSGSLVRPLHNGHAGRVSPTRRSSFVSPSPFEDWHKFRGRCGSTRGAAQARRRYRSRRDQETAVVVCRSGTGRLKVRDRRSQTAATKQANRGENYSEAGSSATPSPTI